MDGGRAFKRIHHMQPLDISDHQNLEMDLGNVETLRLLSRNEPGALSLFSCLSGVALNAPMLDTGVDGVTFHSNG